MNTSDGQPAVLNTLPTGRRVFLLAFAAAFAGLIIKTPGAISHAQFFAEDGVIFFTSQFGHTWPRLLTPYAGYLHTIPRLVAWLASFFPYAQAPLVYNAMAMLLDAWAVAYFATRTSFIAPCWICVAIILLAPSNGEILGTLTNIQWFLQFAVFAMSMLPTSGMQRLGGMLRIAALLSLLAMSLTGPFSALCLILLIGSATLYCLSSLGLPSLVDSLKNWWERTDRPAVIMTAIGGTLQLCVLLIIGQRTNSGHFSFEAAKKLFGEGIERHTLGFVPIPPMAFLGLFIALIAFAIYQAIFKQQVKWLSILFMLAFASLQILPVCYNGNDVLVSAENLNGDRYFFFMKISLYLAVVALLMEYPLARRFKLYAAPPAALFALTIMRPGLAQRPMLADLHWKQSAAILRQGKFPVELPINPVPWKIILQAPPKTDRRQ